MSNYQRNTSLVICIFAVLVIGAVGIGLISYYGTNMWNWNPASTDFSFEAEVGATNETVTLDIDLDAGAVSVVFVENESLLYNINLEVQNSTLEEHGSPTVTFSSNTIRLDYAAAAANITLGSGVNYTINIAASAGAVSLDFDGGCHVGDVTVSATAGAISLRFTGDMDLLGNATFDLDTNVGEINIIGDLPAFVGGSIECAAGVGSVNIAASGWDRITSNHYETSDYSTASQTLTILAETSLGDIDATFV